MIKLSNDGHLGLALGCLKIWYITNGLMRQILRKIVATLSCSMVGTVPTVYVEMY
jgi:hypothetical protein